ncbi:MAG: undecaprenyl/decaprenyl-phosphate alpha-N-acetylglucosaminyl 1-phosphate transferase [Spirochaetaceae bacterium]|jgi:UDP-GlcNAc:undecaprenyl-phosphate GlcNAc-1-phosphate transferase|nr:undecaprenyl/decaprenyl-phosphate alpha-N-acetylglucosaminyl 1-phosphate transferase [Spirochaetaceae bacterium]
MKTIIYAIIALLATVALTPPLIFFCDKKGWYDPINSRKLHQEKIPRLGSIALAPVFFIVSAVYLLKTDSLKLIPLAPILIPAFFIFLVGVLDDFIDMPPKVKFICQCACCIVPPIFGYNWTHFGPLNLGVLALPVTFLWITGMVNAYNLIDGIDALCGGLSFFATAVFGILFYLDGGGFTLPFILCGSILGFLVFNKPKAKIFLGDGGSQFLGYMIAIFPLAAEKPLGQNALPIAVLLASIPIMDTIAAIWRRTRDHISFLLPDKAHLHHKLLAMGYSNKGILFFLFVIQAGICVSVVFIHYKLTQRQAFFFIIGGYFVMTVFFSIIHYTYRSVRTYLPPPPPR